VVIELELNKDFNGVKWNGAEKTYDLVEKINFVIKNMKKNHSEFGLTGELLAQGEDVGDVWRLVMENNVAYEKKIDLSHKKKVTCPHCEEEFFLDEQESNDENFSFVFTGFRDEFTSNRLKELDYEVTENVSKETTHLIMKDTTKKSTKHSKALEYDCEIWSVEQLEDFLNSK
jgi:hypothetical protein